jgi:cytochrome c553
MLILIALLVGLVVAIFTNRGASQQSDAFENALRGCIACHGSNGVSTDRNIPKLRALNYDYMVYQLTRFAGLQPGSSTAGAYQEIAPIDRGLESIRNRQSEIMAQHVGDFDDAVLRDLARHFARLPCSEDEMVKRSLPRPQGTAWCNDCHAPEKVRSTTNVPLLNSQHASYLEAQLLAFKRAAVASDWINERHHHFMSRSVRTMSGQRIRQVSEYYESQACPSGRP